MMRWSGRRVLVVMAVGASMWLTGCGSKVVNQAPVEDRGPAAAAAASAPAPAPPAVDLGPAAQRPLSAQENADKSGYYTVKPGDTLIRIGLDTGQNWKDLARWNSLDNPNLIEVGQVLRVVPPGPVAVTSAVVTRPVASSTVTTTGAPAAAPAASAAASAPAVVAAPVTGATAAAAPAAGGDEDLAWMWPARGAILASFDEVKNKGVDIGGTAGDPVLAAADGRVVYVGASLRGYGNLVILKHNNTYLSAYAHNQLLLVKEDQTVRRGQKIAEMGSSDADRVKLHFEVRRQGKPVDPAKYLPPR